MLSSLVTLFYIYFYQCGQLAKAAVITPALEIKEAKL